MTVTTTLIPLDEALGATLDAVSGAINQSAVDAMEETVTAITDMSHGSITPTEEQRAAICNEECAKLRGQYVQQVKDLSLAFAASLGVTVDIT